MMDVYGSTIIETFRIAITDEKKTDIDGVLRLETRYETFKNKDEMFKRWQELLHKNHQHIELYSTKTQIAMAKRMK